MTNDPPISPLRPSTPRAGASAGGPLFSPASGTGSGAGPVLPPEIAAAADPTRPRLGGHIVVLEELGRGGMGVVHRGWDTAAGREVAVKMILHADEATEAVLRRFRREARAAGKLEHPAIVSALGHGDDGGKPYIVMDYVRGRPLDAIVATEGPLRPARAAALVHALAGALEHAHRAGILHRDIKPQNVLVRDDGRALITDFGLARETVASVALTKTGAFLGTPGFAPPEQCQGELARIGPASDVFGLGAVLFFALTGRPPFDGDTAVQVIIASLSAGPGSMPGVPATLEAIVLRCLEKDPRDRYPSAASLADDLARFAGGKQVAARRAGPIERARRWARANLLVAGLAVAAMTAVGCGVVFSWWWARQAAEQARLESEQEMVERARRAATEARLAFDAARGEEPEPGADAATRRGDRVVALGLDALEAARVLLELVPDDPSARLDASGVAFATANAALAAERWTDARRVAGEAERLTVDPARARRLLDRVERESGREESDARRAAEAILADAGSGELGRRTGGLEDAILALVALDAETTTPLLIDALDGLAERLDDVTHATLVAAADPTDDEVHAGGEEIAGLEAAVEQLLAARAGEPLAAAASALLDRAARRLESREARRLSLLGVMTAPGLDRILATAQAEALGEGRLLLARLSCEVLRLGRRAEATAALGRYLRAERDELRAVHAAIALCAMPGEEARALVDAALARFGPTSGFAEAIGPHLPDDRDDAAGAAGGETMTAAEHAARGSRRLLRGELELALGDFGRALDLDDGEVSAWYGRGVARARRGDASSAIEDLRRAIELAPRRADIVTALGVARARGGDVPGALVEFDRAIEIAPGHADAWWNRGKALQALGRPEEALEAYGRSLDLAPSPAVHAARAELRFRRGDVDGALRDYDAAIGLAPRDATIRFQRGFLRARTGAFDRAVEDYGACIDLDPTIYQAWNQRAIAHFRLGQLDDAVRDSGRAIELAPDQADLFANRASFREAAGDLQGALADGRRAVQLAPGSASHRVNLSSVLIAVGELEEAEAETTRAIEIDPRAKRAFCNRGLARMKRRALEDAAADYRQAIAIDPAYALAYGNLADVLIDIGRHDEAEAAASRSITLRPSDPIGWNNRAKARACLGRIEAAIADAREAVRRGERISLTHHTLGWVLRAAGRNDDAVAAFDRAIELAPGYARAWLDRGIANARRGRVAEARRDLERCVALDPDGATGREARAALEQLDRGGGR